MPKVSKSFQDAAFLAAALEGLELQRKRIEEQIGQVRALLGKRAGSAAKIGNPAAGGARGRRQLSAAARRRIAAAQRKRWAEYRKKAAQKAAAK